MLQEAEREWDSRHPPRYTGPRMSPLCCAGPCPALWTKGVGRSSKSASPGLGRAHGRWRGIAAGKGMEVMASTPMCLVGKGVRLHVPCSACPHTSVATCRRGDRREKHEGPGCVRCRWQASIRSSCTRRCPVERRMHRTRSYSSDGVPPLQMGAARALTAGRGIGHPQRRAGTVAGYLT